MSDSIDLHPAIALVLTFFASFAFIFLKAFQQRNVAFDHHAWIVPTSMLMALVEVYVIANVAAKGFSIALVLAIGIGSGLGALSAAVTHKRMFAK
jgi:hypothetical protein